MDTPFLIFEIEESEPSSVVQPAEPFSFSLA